MNRLSNAFFPARITRGSYFIRWVLLGGVAVMAGGLLEAGGHAAGGAAVVLLGGAVSLILFSCVALFRAILLPRVRDVGLHPAWSLLILLHSVGALFVLALLFVPTDAFASPRRYRYPGA